ncbi:MAG: hypothetical protein WC047_04545 [Kiritimatiellales bacterium]
MNKKTKRPTDINQLAKSIVEQATSETPENAPKHDAATISEVMREMGRRGGLKGGKARAESLSAKRRKEIAKKAAVKRWENKPTS